MARRDSTGRFVPRKKATRKKATRAPRAAADGVAVREIGRPDHLTFTPAGVRSARMHRFGAGARVYATRDGRYLIIGPVRITGRIIRG